MFVLKMREIGLWTLDGRRFRARRQTEARVGQWVRKARKKRAQDGWKIVRSCAQPFVREHAVISIHRRHYGSITAALRSIGERAQGEMRRPLYLLDRHGAIRFPGLDRRLNDELRFQGIQAGAVYLVGGYLLQVLLDPAVDAAAKRLCEAHHAADVVVTFRLAREAGIELQMLAGFPKHEARVRPDHLQRLQPVAAARIIAAGKMAEDAVLKQQIGLQVAPADAPAARPVGARAALEDGVHLLHIAAKIAHDVYRVGMERADMKPGRGF